MEKTKLGLSTGFVAALAFFLCLFGGYLPALLLTGYVLFLEENADLRKTALKALVLMIVFDLLAAVINLIPGLFNLLDGFVTLGGNNFLTAGFSLVVSGVSRVFSLITSILTYGEKILFLIFGFLSFRGKAPAIPFVDKWINKFIG